VSGDGSQVNDLKEEGKKKKLKGMRGGRGKRKGRRRRKAFEHLTR